MKRILVLGAALGLLSTSLPTLSQEVSEVDLDELNYCLGEVGYKGSSDPWDCVGFIAAFCRKNAQDASDRAAIGCLEQEKAVWQTILERRMEDLKSTMLPADFARLAAQRSASPANHSEHCETDEEMSIAAARCLRDMMARRALFVLFSTDVANAP